MLVSLFGRYPASDGSIADYKEGVQKAFKTQEVVIGPTAEIPVSLLETIAPLGVAATSD
jgi:hypothetical protein